MYMLLHYLAEFPYLAIPQATFTVWMIVDVSRRSTEAYWFWVILWFQPLGPWIYFFVVKAKDFRGASDWFAFHSRPSLQELRFRNQQTPTLTSHLELAERLIEMQDYVEAMSHLEAVLKRETDHCGALYWSALCLTEQANPEAAIPLLEKVIARDRAFSDYKAWRLLIQARTQAGDAAGALAACRDLFRIAPTLQHCCLLGEHLLADGKDREAEDLLAQALEEYQFAPGPSRRRNRRWAVEARRLQKQLVKVAAQK